jgi:hypothetical protein
MCGIWGNTWHWTVAAAPADRAFASRPRLAVRAEQAAILSSITAASHVKISDWSGSSWLITGPSGATEVVETLSQVWESIERLSARRLDPLADEFTRYLVATGD